MGRVFVFRGKAASGKTTLANMLGAQLKVPVLCKDDILEPIKVCNAIEDRGLWNAVCYRTLVRLVQRLVDNGCDVILDIGLGHKEAAENFLSKIEFKDSEVISFTIECKDMNEWRRRHEERIANPKPSQSFRSFEHVLSHYEHFNTELFDNEYAVDSSRSVDESFKTIWGIVGGEPKTLLQSK